MSVNYNTPTISNRLQQVVNAMDAGASTGVLRLMDAGGTILSSLSLVKPSATIAGNLMTFSGLSLVDPAAAASGTATAARIEDSTGTVVISGLTVGTGPGVDIILSPTNAIIAGQVIAIQQATITGQ
jgi:hypothetical protein